jgi:hypothetical protein
MTGPDVSPIGSNAGDRQGKEESTRDLSTTPNPTTKRLILEVDTSIKAFVIELERFASKYVEERKEKDLKHVQVVEPAQMGNQLVELGKDRLIELGEDRDRIIMLRLLRQNNGMPLTRPSDLDAQIAVSWIDGQYPVRAEFGPCADYARVFLISFYNHCRQTWNTRESNTSLGKIELHIEDIDSFAKAKNITPQEVKPLVPLNLLEDQVQTSFEEIIGENFHQEDCGGEMNDVVSSQVRVGERRLRTAFILKGRGTKGKLTIKGCGKNGDQIVRLVEAPVDLYVVQHVDEIDQRVVYDLKSKVELKNRKGEPCQMCIIDGTDTARILVAYGKIPGASEDD